MSESSDSPDQKHKKNTNKYKAEISDEQKFTHKKIKQFKKNIENIKLEEKWQDWDEYQ
jgi:hypothetical protein